MPLHLLAVGDLHLGRRPGSLPEDLRDREQGRRLGPAGALRRLVERAIAQEVDAVLLAGDLVDDGDDFFEAYRDLHQAVAQLVSAGIRVLGVAGNHDTEVLPRLANELPDFQLLGSGGTWQSTCVRSEDGTEAVIHGWSFPGNRVTISPLLEQQFQRDARVHLGLLHCDRDQTASHHAPVRSSELSMAGLDAWLLGHIHKPDQLSTDQPSGYLGSVTPLRRTENGVHGPWLYRIEGSHIAAVTQWPLAPLRWERLDLDITGITDAEQVFSQLLAAIRNCASELVTQSEAPEVLGLNVIFQGRSNLGDLLEQHLGRERLEHIPVHEDFRCFVGSLDFRLVPEVDIELLSQEKSPAGLLAQRLRLLDAPADEPARQSLLQRARERLQTVASDSAWQQLDHEALDETAVEDWLRQALNLSLNRLIVQREENP